MSNDDDNYSIAARYRTVRKHLDVLGYRQALSLDSLPLIELLLVDLAQTKDTLKHFQTLAKENIQTCSQLQLAVDPYKCDNARLVQECNKAHLELLEAKEEFAKQSNDYKKQIRKLESEVSDLQLSFSKNLERIKLLETESANKSKKISELLGKCCKPIVNNANLATKKRPCYPLRKPVVEADPLPKVTTSSCTKKVEPYVIDFVSMADRRISSLTCEVTKLKEELFLSNENAQMLKKQLNAKDKELDRLRKMLEGGRPCTSVGRDHCSIRSKCQCPDNEEFECLRREKLELEQQLRESLNKQHEAMTQTIKLAERNEELERELKDVDKLAMAVEADCNTTVKENNKRVCRLQEKLDNLLTKVHVLQTELTMQRREAQELRADLEACRLEKSNLQRTLENTLEEKKHMTDRVNSLTMLASKSNKNADEEQCSKQKKCCCQCQETKTHDKNVVVESLQSTIERLESERDHYKHEYMKIKDQFKKDFEKDSENLWSQICELREQISEKERSISKLLREKKDLCREKFDLENQLHIQQVTPSTHRCSCRTSPINERKNVGLNSKIERLEREKDCLRADIERLIGERDSLRERLQEGRRAAMSGLDEQLDDLREELRHTKQELSEQRTQYFQLRTLQDQTDQALGDVQTQLTDCETELTAAVDRNKILERQQMQLDCQIQELRQEIGTYRSRMAQMERDKDQLLMDLDEKTEKIAALEREIDFKEQQSHNLEQQIRDLSHTKQICADQAADLDRQMRSLQLDIENQQRQLSSANIDRENAIQENRRLQDDLAAASCDVRKLHKELEASKAEAHDLKRQLQTYVAEVRRAEELLAQKENERTEMLNHFRSLSLEASVLENNNHSLESEAAEARGALQSARDQVADLERQMANKECLIRGYEAQITELTQNVASLEIQLQQATDQRLHAEDDLRTVRDLCVTLEKQKECITHRLEENIELKTQFEVQVERYRSEQEIFQEQLNKDHKTIDRLERLLEEARKETMVSQANARDLQAEVSKLRQKIVDLQGKLCSETAEVRKYQNQASEFSKQITDLRRQITNERYEKSRLREESRSRTHEIRRVQDDHLRSDKDFVPTTQLKCACKEDGDEPELLDNAYGESSSFHDSTIVPDECDNTSGYQQTEYKMCLCGRSDDDLANAKIMKDARNSRKNRSSDPFNKEYKTCHKCMPCINQRRHDGSSIIWLVETLLLVNKFMAEKRRRKKPEQDKFKSSTINVQLHDVLDEKAENKGQQSIGAYSNDAMQFNRSTSTQTLEDSGVDADRTKAPLLDILAEIQQYAKSIQDYFYKINESLKQQQSLRKDLTQDHSRSITIQNNRSSRNQSPNLNVSPRRHSPTGLHKSKTMIFQKGMSSESSMTEHPSRRSNPQESYNTEYWYEVPYSSTPVSIRQSPMERSYLELEDREMFREHPIRTNLQDDLESIDSFDSTQYMSLPNRRKITEPNVNFDEEYYEIPEQMLSNESLNELEETRRSRAEEIRERLCCRGVSENESRRDLSGVATLASSALEEDIEEPVNMDAIKKKIENLRCEVFNDLEQDKSPVSQEQKRKSRIPSFRRKK